MNKFKMIATSLAVAAMVSGCASDDASLTGNSTLSEAGALSETGALGGDDQLTSVETSGLQSGSDFSGDPLNDPQSELSKRVIYFLYDSSEIQPEYQSVISSHADYLINNRNKKVILEGHGDERGSREYNIALGEQRANSVARILKLQGVDPAQIQVVSYGEERPASMGHDDAAWSINRRVELDYR